MTLFQNDLIELDTSSRKFLSHSYELLQQKLRSIEFMFWMNLN